MKKRILIMTFFFLALFISTGGASMQQSRTALPVQEEALKTVASKKIFFGHQSVGFNILDGVKDIYGSSNIRLNLVKGKEASLFNGPVFAHNPIGHNDSPESKIEDFENFMRNGLGGKADIAFLKLCYVDVKYTSDVNGLFKRYKEAMARLKKEYPKTKFVHVTVPLTISASPLKGFVKSLMGKEDNNIKRQLFNEMLRKEYSGKEPLFDLALIESTRPDGTRTELGKKGDAYYALASEYTDDGGHLNGPGKKVVAAELLRFLSDI